MVHHFLGPYATQPAIGGVQYMGMAGNMGPANGFSVSATGRAPSAHPRATLNSYNAMVKGKGRAPDAFQSQEYQQQQYMLSTMPNTYANQPMATNTATDSQPFVDTLYNSQELGYQSLNGIVDAFSSAGPEMAPSYANGQTYYGLDTTPELARRPAEQPAPHQYRHRHRHRATAPYPPPDNLPPNRHAPVGMTENFEPRSLPQSIPSSSAGRLYHHEVQGEHAHRRWSPPDCNPVIHYAMNHVQAQPHVLLNASFDALLAYGAKGAGEIPAVMESVSGLVAVDSDGGHSDALFSLGAGCHAHGRSHPPECNGAVTTHLEHGPPNSLFMASAQTPTYRSSPSIADEYLARSASLSSLNGSNASEGGASYLPGYSNDRSHNSSPYSRASPPHTTSAAEIQSWAQGVTPTAGPSSATQQGKRPAYTNARGRPAHVKARSTKPKPQVLPYFTCDVDETRCKKVLHVDEAVAHFKEAHAIYFDILDPDVEEVKGQRNHNRLRYESFQDRRKKNPNVRPYKKIYCPLGRCKKRHAPLCDDGYVAHLEGNHCPELEPQDVN